MIGRSLSHFRITAKLGEGGMGEVYRAEDTKLGREVAIKVLPELLTADPERLARFEREAKVLASLNHPNIAGIHQIEEADGQQLLVMELVEGEDLADRLGRGAIEIDEATGIARQIATGLEAAHERGIVHRDLKPANIKVTPEGQVKILDFGLAKAHEAAEEASPDMTRSPTLTAQMTQAGMILGTAAYMSPEQARGQEADARADIWSMGVVFYEMLTGERLFADKTVSDTLAAVLRAEIDWEALPEGTPRSLRRVLRRCLEREPKQRYHAAADVRIDLEESFEEGSDEVTMTEAGEAPSSRVPWVVAASASAVALWLAFFPFGPAGEAVNPDAGARVVSSLIPPAEADFDLDGYGLALSPDGTRLAFVARGRDQVGSIWIEDLARGGAEKLARTEDAGGPFWSPDGRSLGFAQDSALRTLDLETGVVETLAEQSFPDGAAWSASGEIVFGEDNEDLPLLAVKQAGGTPRPVTEKPAAGEHFFAPDFLPDGQHFLFHARRYGSEEQFGQIRVGSLDGSESKYLFDAFSVAKYVEPGLIVWWHQGNLRAQRFDLDLLELVGEPFPIASNVRFDPRSAFAAATMAAGRLVYQSGGRVAGNQLVWYGRDGERLGAVGEPGSLYGPRVSPDGSRIALDISGDSNQGDIWVLDAERGSGSRVTVWPEDDSYPIWSPDGEELMFSSSRGEGIFKLYQVDFQGGTEPELVLGKAGGDVIAGAWPLDGTRVFFSHSTENQIWELDTETGETRSVIESGFVEGDFSVSPDGNWIAFGSSETGQREVYLASLPRGDQRARVSTEGGFAPLWARDGREIFFMSPHSDAILRASVTFEAGRPVIGPVEKLIGVEMKVHRRRQFDTVDGQRFLLNTSVNSGARTPLTLVVNWRQEP